MFAESNKTQGFIIDSGNNHVISIKHQGNQRCGKMLQVHGW